MASIEEGLPAITEEEREYIASQWSLVRRRFFKHRLGVIATAVVLLLYFIAIFAEFFAIHEPLSDNASRVFVPPQKVHFFDGKKPSWPYMDGIIRSRNPVTLKPEYAANKEEKFSIRFFVRGHDYKFMGLFFRTDWHFMGLDTDQDPMPFYLLGSDRLGRDLFFKADDGYQDIHVHWPD